jgi:O-antigen/teichoic acid export membrane protein
MGEQHSVAIKSFGWDTLKYVPYRIFPVLFGFIGLWVYTQIFSPADYGDYTLINTTIFLINIFVYTWIDESNLRFYTKYKDSGRLDVYFSTSFLMLTGALVAMSLLITALSWLSILPAAISNYLILVVAEIIVLSFFEILLTLLRANRKAMEASFYRSVSAVFMLVVSLICIFVFNLGIASILLGFIVTDGILALAIILRYRYLSYIHLRSFSMDTLKLYASYGMPLMLTTIFSWVLLLSDRYFINFYWGSADVGIYSAAFQLADYPISMVTSMMLIAAWPIIIDTFEKHGEEQTKSLVTGLSRYYFLFVIPAVIGVSLLSRDMITILTASYAIGFTIIPLVCLSKAMFGICWYMNVGLELKRKTALAALLIAVTGVIDVSMNIVLVPVFGFFGSGLALVTSYIIYTILSFVIAKKYLNFALPLNTIKNILISAGAMAAVLLLAKSYMDVSLVRLVLLVALGAVVYLAGILLTGEVKGEADGIKKLVFGLFSSMFPRLSRRLSRLVS